MVGGDEYVTDRCRSVLEILGRKILRTGPVGSAQAMKALNNLVSVAGLVVSLEALAIGQQFGLDPATMVDVLNVSSGMNNSTQNKLKPFVLSRSFDSGFSLELMAKDIGIALSIAHDTNTTVPFSAYCEQLWATARGLLQQGADHTEIARLIEKVNGFELGGNQSSERKLP
jgi:3-hydroxyisobutyrate dehydrogenase